MIMMGKIFVVRPFNIFVCVHLGSEVGSEVRTQVRRGEVGSEAGIEVGTEVGSGVGSGAGSEVKAKQGNANHKQINAKHCKAS